MARVTCSLDIPISYGVVALCNLQPHYEQEQKHPTSASSNIPLPLHIDLTYLIMIHPTLEDRVEQVLPRHDHMDVCEVISQVQQSVAHIWDEQINEWMVEWK